MVCTYIINKYIFFIHCNVWQKHPPPISLKPAPKNFFYPSPNIVYTPYPPKPLFYLPQPMILFFLCFIQTRRDIQCFLYAEFLGLNQFIKKNPPWLILMEEEKTCKNVWDPGKSVHRVLNLLSCSSLPLFCLLS